ncbi:tRNA lysidine(34) synthetase TilS [Stieleria sp. TO1_6]|nr:tRNA lysidine(34) synthetase TilS [Stieleria tagensis]
MKQFDAWQSLLKSVQSAWPAWPASNVGVVVGCSGGADSVALLHSLVQLADRDTKQRPIRPGFVVVAHFNHRLRGAESDADAHFVKNLADRLGLRFELGSGDPQKSDEESTRNERREFLADVVRRSGARYLALGHSLDDNAETILYRLMRGTGPAGLRGIAPFRPLSDDPSGSDFVIARPLLSADRQSIRDAMRSADLPWREDRSNQSPEYHRNWIRNQLIPLMQTQFPDAVAAIGRAIDGQSQWAAVIDQQVDQWTQTQQISPRPLTLRRLQPDSIDSNAQQAIAIEALRRYWLQSQWPLQAMTQSHWNRIYALLCGQGPDAITMPGSIQIRRDHDQVTFKDTITPSSASAMTDKFSDVYHATSSSEALLLIGRLADVGITAFAEGDDASQSMAIGGGIGPGVVKVLVNPADQEQAQKVIADESNAHGELKSWTCKNCGEFNFESFESCWKCSASMR